MNCNTCGCSDDVTCEECKKTEKRKIPIQELPDGENIPEDINENNL